MSSAGRMQVAKKPVNSVVVGDEVLCPWGRYVFRVTELHHVGLLGVYTRVPEDGYRLGDRASYLKSDWRDGMCEVLIRKDHPDAAG